MKNSVEENPTPFSIYRLCRDDQTLQRFFANDEKYHFAKTFNQGKLDYFEFLRKIIVECKDDFALVCHDDVVLPFDIEDRVCACVQNADDEFGKKNWGLIGNVGIDYFSGDSIRYLKDPHSAFITPRTIKPHVVISIDGNTLLINIKNFKERNVSLPNGLKGFHLYDFILLAEAYAKGLICAVDSNLFVVHKSKGNQKDFNKEIASSWFIDYWNKRYINHAITTINADYDLENNLKYIQKNSSDDRVDFYASINATVKKVFMENSQEVKQLNIVVRTMLNKPEYLRRALQSINIASLQSKGKMSICVILAINNANEENIEKILSELQNEFNFINIIPVICKQDKNYYPRVLAIKEALAMIPDEKNAFVWLVDDDDFVFPAAIEFFEIFLDPAYIFIGDSVVFFEKWNESGHGIFPDVSNAKSIVSAKKYFELLVGDNHIPICSVVYPAGVLKKIFDSKKMKGDYYEDYALLLFALKELDVRVTSLRMAGISHHDDNTVLQKDRTHWDHSYATFMSEVVNGGFMSRTVYDYIKRRETERNVKLTSSRILSDFSGLLSKTIKTIKRRGFKKSLKYSFLFLKHGRGHFRNGIDSVECNKN